MTSESAKVYTFMLKLPRNETEEISVDIETNLVAN